MHNAVEHEMGSSHYNFDGFSCITARLEFHFKTILTVYCSQRRRQCILIQFFCDCDTGKSFSEVLILASTNPQYDKRLSIKVPVQYMKIPSSEHCLNMLCTQIVLNVTTKTKNQFVF